MNICPSCKKWTNGVKYCPLCTMHRNAMKKLFTVLGWVVLTIAVGGLLAGARKVFK